MRLTELLTDICDDRLLAVYSAALMATQGRRDNIPVIVHVLDEHGERMGNAEAYVLELYEAVRKAPVVLVDFLLSQTLAEIERRGLYAPRAAVQLVRIPNPQSSHFTH